MTPTNKLRFVKREVQVPAPEFGPNFTRGVEVRVLQQWWEPDYPGSAWSGEWQDVPLQEEA
jgi:hypothetical protein